MAQGRMTVADDDIIAAFRESDDPILTANEVADYFDMTRQWAHQRLEDLANEGSVKKKRSGRRTVVWWLPD